MNLKWTCSKQQRLKRLLSPPSPSKKLSHPVSQSEQKEVLKNDDPQVTTKETSFVMLNMSTQSK